MSPYDQVIAELEKEHSLMGLCLALLRRRRALREAREAGAEPRQIAAPPRPSLPAPKPARPARTAATRRKPARARRVAAASPRKAHPPLTALAESLRARLSADGAELRELASHSRAPVSKVQTALQCLRRRGLARLERSTDRRGRWFAATLAARPSTARSSGGRATAPAADADVVWNGAMDRTGTAPSLLGSR